MFLLLILPCSANAQNMTEPDLKNKPANFHEAVEAKVAVSGTPVLVEHSGNDAIGGMLALKLKENLNKSSLFKLADKDNRALRIRVISKSEFKDRPGVGSTYAIIWTFAENENVLAYYLADFIGIVDNSSLELEAEKLTSMTDKFVDQYKFLFN